MKVATLFFIFLFLLSLPLTRQESNLARSCHAPLIRIKKETADKCTQNKLHVLANVTQLTSLYFKQSKLTPIIMHTLKIGRH